MGLAADDLQDPHLVLEREIGRNAHTHAQRRYACGYSAGCQTEG